MSSNRIPRNPTRLISLAEDAADGAHDYGVAVGLKQNTETDIRADLVDLIGNPTAVPPLPGKQTLLAAAKSAKSAAAATQRSADSNGRAQVARCVDVLKGTFGRTWNAQWHQVGLTHQSLAVPEDPLSALNALAVFLGQNSAFGNVPGGVTPAACSAAASAVSAARTASNARASQLADALQLRDLSREALYQRLSGLRGELSQKLGDDDPRWYNFGFDRPADGQQPGLVLNLILVPGGPGMIYADWDDARRAERYRVFKQIVGVDVAPSQIGPLVTDSESTLTGLPSGATVKIHIIPVNDAGDGPESEVVQIVVP